MEQSIELKKNNILNLGSTIKRDLSYNNIRSNSLNKTGQIYTLENTLSSDTRVFDVINKYRGTLQYTNAILSGPAGNGEKDKDGNEIKKNKVIYNQIASPSLFNPYYSLLASGPAPNVPLLDTHKNNTDISAIGSDKTGEIVEKKIRLIPTDDCSIKNLVELSKLKHGPLGQARYKYSDFMYCNDLGKVSNNHLITLRRFDSPVTDNIFYGTTIDDDSNLSIKGDIGRLITWFGTDDNKLEDILKYTVNAKWKPLEAKIQEKQSQENDPERGLMGNFCNLFNPAYNKSTEKGVSPSSLGFLLATSSSDALYTSAPYANNPAVNGSAYDQNRVYEPKDTIRSTHVYDGALTFENEFSLTFKYKLRGYDNINAKSAFLDLLANILVVTYKQGTFWGGEQRIIGSPQNKAGWKKAEEFTNKGLDAGGTFISSMLNGDSLKDAGSVFAQSIASAFNSSFGFDLSSIFGDPAEAFRKTIESLKKAEVGKAIKGMFHNQLGRPAIYAFDSLLTNDAVGLWHVTVGNPLNPIAVMGNLIMTNAEISHSGPLGLDDFPTELAVTVTLKHGTPRDSVDIQRMYTSGRHAIYTKISNFNNFKLPEQQKETPKDDSNDLSNVLSNQTESLAEVISDKPTGETNKKEEQYFNYKLITPNLQTINLEEGDYAMWIGDGDITRIKSNKESLK